MKISAAVAAGVAGLSALVALSAPAAEAAAPRVVISAVKFDSSGKDLPVSDTKLNDEYVVLKNVSTSDVAISGWTLRDKAGHRFTFAKKTVIKAGDWMRIHTGPGHTTPHHKYWDHGYYIWNNDGDTAYFRNKSGSGGDTCSWTGDESRGIKTC